MRRFQELRNVVRVMREVAVHFENEFVVTLQRP